MSHLLVSTRALLCVLALGALLPAQEFARFIDQMALSPDGKTLVVAWRGDLWRAPAEGGDLVRLTTDAAGDSQPQVSPDGKTLAFISTRSGSAQIWTMPLEGGTPVQITRNTDGYELVQWLHNGDGFLVRAARDHFWDNPARFMRQPLDGSLAPTVLFDCYGMNGSLSPDGRYLLFQRESDPLWRKAYTGSQAGQIWLFDSASKTFTELHRDEGGSRHPMFGGDSNTYWYLHQKVGGAWNFVRVNRVTGESELVTKFEEDGAMFPAISRDGQTIVFMRHFSPWRLDVRTGVASAIDLRYIGEPLVPEVAKLELERSTDCDITDDGREIAFIAAGDVWVMDTELREPRRVTATPEEEREVMWSKDFQSLWFISDVGGEANIWSARRADPEKYWWQTDRFLLKRLTDDPEVEAGLRLHEDGKRIAYYRGNSLWSMTTEGKDAKELIASWNRPIYDFSPDGKWIAYSVEDDDYNDDVWLKPLDGSRPPFNLSAHPDDDRAPVFSADGKFLAFTGRRWGEEVDIVWVPLQVEIAERSDRDERLEKALEKMKGRKEKTPAAEKPNPGAVGPGGKDAPGEIHPLSGTWKGTIMGPPPIPSRGLPFTMKLSFDANGRISGEATSVLGTLKALDYAFDRAGGSFEVTFDREGSRLMVAGKLDGEKASGSWTMAEETGTFSAERTEKGAPVAPAAKPEPAKDAKPEAEKKDEKKDAKKNFRIDFDGIHDRLRRISIPDSFESNLVFAPKDATLYFQAVVSGKRGTYTVDLPNGTQPKEARASITRPGRYIDEGKSWASNAGGRPTITSLSGSTTSYDFKVWLDRPLGEHHAVLFDQAWRAMRDGWYDERLGNKNWDAIRAKYRAHALLCRTPTELGMVGNAMLGELNGSHLGFTPGSVPGLFASASRPDQWREITGHLGTRFDPLHRGPGLLVKDVIKDTPAARAASRIEPGELIISIDGVRVDPSMDASAYLHGRPGRMVEVLVQGKDGERRTVSMVPTTSGAVRGRLYQDWIDDNRAMVDTLSGGTFGYVHIQGMGGGNLLTFDEELYRIGAGKDGLVIDVRENGGGSIADHLLTMLCQPTHAITRARGSAGTGYPQDRRIYATWSKPIVVLCNQNSFSNAEIFSHAVKTLGRGRVVGVPTAGGVISTGGASLFEGTFVRMPFRGWYTLDGEDMELNGCVPHFTLWPAPTEWTSGKDRQLEKAVEVLKEDVTNFKARPAPPLRKAMERLAPR